MRILLHDFAGHPFQVQLSRELAGRGHVVLHTYCASLQTTPRGALTRASSDPATLEIRGVQLARPLEKFSFLTRWRQENEYGRHIARAAREFNPDVVLSGNTPLDAQQMLLNATRSVNGRFVYWVQDLLGVATERLLRKKNVLLAETVGRYYARKERALLRRSDAVVLITDDFKSLMTQWGIQAPATTIENWAPLDEVLVRPKDNPWSRRHGLVDSLCFLYSGTLGMKHDPQRLVELARLFSTDPGVRIVVVSQGRGADWLRLQKSEQNLENLTLLGFQDFSAMPDVLATGDVLLGVLERDAGVFSVPSKVLTYFCAARPVLLAVPPENLAARLVIGNEAGLVVHPDDSAGFLDAARRLSGDAALRHRLGSNARRYAEAAFDVSRIADRFERILLPSL